MLAMQRNDNQNALHKDKLKQIVGGTENTSKLNTEGSKLIFLCFINSDIYTCTIISPEQAIAFPKQ